MVSNVILLTVAVCYSYSLASAATTTTAETTSFFSSTDSTTWWPSSSESSTDFSTGSSSSTDISTEGFNSTESSTDYTSSSTYYSSSSTYYTSSSESTTFAGLSNSTDNTTLAIESTTCWWCTLSPWPTLNTTLVTFVFGGGVTTTTQDYQSKDPGYTGITNMSIAAVGGIVVGCAALVSLGVILIVIKAYGSGAAVPVTTVSAAPDCPKAMMSQPPPPHQNYSAPQYTYHGQQLGQPNKYTGSHNVDLY